MSVFEHTVPNNKGSTMHYYNAGLLILCVSIRGRGFPSFPSYMYGFIYRNVDIVDSIFLSNEY